MEYAKLFQNRLFCIFGCECGFLFVNYLANIEHPWIAACIMISRWFSFINRRFFGEFFQASKGGRSSRCDEPPALP